MSYRKKSLPLDEYKKQRSENAFDKGLNLYYKFKNIFSNSVPCHKRIKQFVQKNQLLLDLNGFSIEELKYLSCWTESRKFAIQNEQKRKKKIKPISHHRITKEQERILEKAQFVKMKSHNERWNENYKRLVRYKENYDSVIVSKTNDKSLYMWLYHQKSAYKNKCRMDNGLKPLTKSRINSEQIKKLETLGVKFYRSHF